MFTATKLLPYVLTTPGTAGGKAAAMPATALQVRCMRQTQHRMLRACRQACCYGTSHTSCFSDTARVRHISFRI